MESPPSSSSWSQAFILSDDSGLLLTNGSVSSTTSSFESRSFGRKCYNFEDSDCEEHSLSQDDSFVSNEQFNTLKKGPCNRNNTSPIDPPLEFQDKPRVNMCVDSFSTKLCNVIINDAVNSIKRREKSYSINKYTLRAYTPSDFVAFSPRRLPTRLSSSHGSLVKRCDDSTFITQAVSHDALSDAYSAVFDSSDAYAVPVDVLRPKMKVKKVNNGSNTHRKRRKSSAKVKSCSKKCRSVGSESKLTKRSNTSCSTEPIHMTLLEVRQYLQTLYSSSSDSESKTVKSNGSILLTSNNNNKFVDDCNIKSRKSATFTINIKNKKVKDCSSSEFNVLQCKDDKKKKSTKFLNFKQALCNMFKFKKILSPDSAEKSVKNDNILKNRALPPLPTKNEENIRTEEEQIPDFATSIQRVKDYGWYWGPISSEAAEKILSNEPDGSFIVRDSSDDHYIFSLTLKLNNSVRHVRIEHDQGNFSFGSCAKFKSQTIVEFIENAVEHSRSGRYLFFLHRRPVMGPVRVQLLHPVSRFKQVQSLQHMCRFVVHKNVRRDLIPSLPLPRRLIDYLNTPHCYSELMLENEF